MSKFQVHHTFTLECQRLFVLAGLILDGEVRAGMIVNVPLNSSAFVSGQIHNVEFARSADEREDVCLCISYEDSDELELWEALNIKNETLDVVPSTNSNDSTKFARDPFE